MLDTYLGMLYTILLLVSFVTLALPLVPVIMTWEEIGKLDDMQLDMGGLQL